MHHNYRRKSAKHHKAKIMFHCVIKKSLVYYKNLVARKRRREDKRHISNEKWESIQSTYYRSIAWMVY